MLPSLAQKIPNKIYICRELNVEQFSHWDFSKFRIECELKIGKALCLEFE
jgi:hypothetical protein